MAEVPEYKIVDLKYRPVLHRRPAGDIDDDDPTSRLIDVAYCWLGYSMHGDGISVGVEVTDNGFKYVVYPDDWDWNESPDGSISEESELPMSLGELLLFLETPIYDGMWIHAPFSYYWFDAVDGRPFPIDAINDVEYSSDVYPGFATFYKALQQRFISICNETGEPPDQDEWSELVLNVIAEGLK